MADLASRIEKLKKVRVVAIMRKLPSEELLNITDALVEAGVTALEITMDSAGAAKSIQEVVKRYSSDILVGAGTLMTVEQIDAAVDVGAQFLLTPHLDTELIQKAHAAQRPMVPGVLTPTEIATAKKAGAEILKLFPAGPLGVGYLKDLLGPFAGTSFVPTGGLTPDNLGDFLKAGAVGVGLGSSLVSKQDLANHDWTAIKARAATVLKNAQESAR